MVQNGNLDCRGLKIDPLGGQVIEHPSFFVQVPFTGRVELLKHVLDEESRAKGSLVQLSQANTAAALAPNQLINLKSSPAQLYAMCIPIDIFYLPLQVPPITMRK